MDNGSMGVGQVAENNQGNLFGHIAIFSLAAKIARDLNTDIHFEILHGNTGALRSARRSELEMIDTQSWISVKKRERLAAAPMWGHL